MRLIEDTMTDTASHEDIGHNRNEAEFEPEIESRPVGESGKDGGDQVESVLEEELSIEDKLVAMEAQAAEYLDGWQRARAEFANARKRLERQRAEAYNNAGVDYAKKLLPILDDFERAVNNVPETIEEDSWFEGLAIVQRKLNGILDGLNVQRIEAVGHPFDPNFHEALALMEVDGVESGIVIEELQTGFRLGDRIIRPSLVNVAA